MATATMHGIIVSDQSSQNDKPTPRKAPAPTPILEASTDHDDRADDRPSPFDHGSLRADWLDSLVWDLD